MSTSFWIRADAGPGIGLGHVARQLAMAEVARSCGHDVRIVPGDFAPAHDLVARHHFAISSRVGWIARVAPGDVALFDGYGLAPGDVAAVRGRGAVAVWFEDRALDGRQPPADLVVSPNPPAPVPEPTERLLVGPTYSLVREEFRAARRVRTPGTGTILVAMGGTDPLGRSSTVVRAVVDSGRFGRVVLLAGATTDVGTVPSTVEIVRSPPSVAALVDGVDAALTAAGATTWELLTMGLPTAVLVLFDNQIGVARSAVELDAVIEVEGHGDPAAVRSAVDRLADPGRQAHLHQQALATVDGRGAFRVLDAALALARS